MIRAGDIIHTQPTSGGLGGLSAIKEEAQANGTAAARIAAGTSLMPLILPNFEFQNSLPPISSAVSATNRILAEVGGDEDINGDTEGFYFDDENIFDTHTQLQDKKRSFGPKGNTIPGFNQRRTLAKIAARPLTYLKINGEDYEFLGSTENVIGVTDDEINSFEGYGEYSEFGKKFFKKVGKTLKAGVKLAAGTALKSTPLGMAGSTAKGLFGLFRKKKKVSRFDGLEEYDYFIGDHPETSSLFGIKLKKVGKALKKAVKAPLKAVKAVGKGVGKAVKATGKGIGSLAKATGKGAKNLTKWVGKVTEKAIDRGALDGAFSAPNTFDETLRGMGVTKISEEGESDENTDTSNKNNSDPAESNKSIYGKIAIAIVVVTVAIMAYLYFKKNK